MTIVANLLTIFTLLTPQPVDDTHCIAHAIYHEARGESTLGQAAVASVVINRTKAPGFPKRPCEVVYQPYQFTNITQTKPRTQSPEWQRALFIANLAERDILFDPTLGAEYFHSGPKPKWAHKLTQTAVIGGHTFLRSRDGVK